MKQRALVSRISRCLGRWEQIPFISPEGIGFIQFLRFKLGLCEMNAFSLQEFMEEKTLLIKNGNSFFMHEVEVECNLKKWRNQELVAADNTGGSNKDVDRTRGDTSRCHYRTCV